MSTIREENLGRVVCNAQDEWATSDDLEQAKDSIVSSAVSKLNTLTAPPDLSNITQQIQGLSDLLNSRLPSFVVSNENDPVPEKPCLKVVVTSSGDIDSIWYDDGIEGGASS